jgi:hypothetical protein
MAKSGVDTAGRGGISARSIKTGGVNGRCLHDDVLKKAYVKVDFKEQPSLTKTDGYTAPSGTTGDWNRARFRQMVSDYFVLGAGQTILGPVLGSSGLDVAQDKTNNEGVMHVFGGDPTNGTSNPFMCQGHGGIGKFAKLRFTIADVSGTDDCAFGWMKAEAGQANFDDLTDFFALNVISGDIKRESALNNAATVTVDTTKNWADGETHTLEVWVLGDGTVKAFVDGVEATTGAAYTFDTGDKLVPFLFLLHDVTTPGAVYLVEFEAGTLQQVGKDAAHR